VTPPFFSIGHSDRSLAAFISLLGEARIELVADIRKMPASRANPQFNAQALQDGLAQVGISYEHMAALGGLRGKAPASGDLNGLWTNRSFRNYADYALGEPFQVGLRHLLERGRRWRCALMCAEAVWWRCHRRIVADYLLARGETVFHIIGAGRLEAARLTPGAVIRADGTIIYPAAPPVAGVAASAAAP